MSFPHEIGSVLWPERLQRFRLCPFGSHWRDLQRSVPMKFRVHWTPDSVTPSAEDRKDLHFSVYIIHLYGMRQHTFFAWTFQILTSEASSDLPRLYTMKIKMQHANFAHFLYCKPFAILKFLSCAFDEYFLHTYDTDMIYIFFVATLISSNFNRKSISILVLW